MALIATDAPLRIRFELSRPAFDDAAAEGEAASAAATDRELADADRTGQPLAAFDTDGRVGLYPAGRIFANPDIVSVEPSIPMLTSGWFEYFPGGLPTWWSEPGSEGTPHRLSLGDGWWALWFSPISLD